MALLNFPNATNIPNFICLNFIRHGALAEGHFKNNVVFEKGDFGRQDRNVFSRLRFGAKRSLSQGRPFAAMARPERGKNRLS